MMTKCREMIMCISFYPQTNAQVIRSTVRLANPPPAPSLSRCASGISYNKTKENIHSTVNMYKPGGLPSSTSVYALTATKQKEESYPRISMQIVVKNEEG